MKSIAYLVGPAEEEYFSQVACLSGGAEREAVSKGRQRTGKNVR